MQKIEDYQYVYTIFYLSKNDDFITAPMVHRALNAGSSEKYSLDRLKLLARQGLIYCEYTTNPNSKKKAHLFYVREENLKKMWYWLLDNYFSVVYTMPLYKGISISKLITKPSEGLSNEIFKELWPFFGILKHGVLAVNPQNNKSENQELDKDIREKYKISNYTILRTLADYFCTAICAPYIINDIHNSGKDITTSFCGKTYRCSSKDIDTSLYNKYKEFKRRKIVFSKYLNIMHNDDYMKKVTLFGMENSMYLYKSTS